MKITSLVFAALCLIGATPSAQAQAATPLPLYVIDTEQVADGGFQNQPTGGHVSSPWLSEGNGVKTAIESRFGDKRAAIRAREGEWNALTQVVTVEPRAQYRVKAQIRTSDNVHDGYFGVRSVADNKVISETKFGPVAQGPGRSYKEVSFTFDTRPDQHQVVLFVGFWGVRGDSTFEVDDVSLRQYILNPRGELFRIKTWVKVTASDDGFADNTLECYGILRINNDVWWNINRDKAGAHARSRGQILAISEDVAGRRGNFSLYYHYSDPLPVLDLRLRDADTVGADDDIGIFNFPLDVRAMAKNGGNYPFFWADKNNGDATELDVTVEHEGYIR